ncbi:M56 family metallopeptidase [Dyadobacter psychrotolerans]|uniref:M56 family metallopeptidase n=1 Tax=Dyadobacter psychrotolerans TaxID=2541721 RepID=A0A4R5DNB5_9BACT|nr:M56 family metallopeptidase [Dyadobacter psychrotolerans]TDE15689.1 hypothetical protein E0F88_14430 [Dyadobacter psychrotolerans]
MNDFFLYLVQVSAGLVLLSLVYKFLFEKLTFFEWNRFYLVGGLCVCIILPLVSVSAVLSVFEPTPGNAIINTVEIQADFSSQIVPFTFEIYPTIQSSFYETLLNTLLAVYITGVLYKVVLLIRSLSFLSRLRRKATLIKSESFCKTYTQNIQPTFSFGKSIFLHEDSVVLSSLELEQVLLHEQTHIRQYHTADIILFEIAAIAFWFNPCLKHLSDALRKTHEYLVDKYVSAVSNDTVGYGELLVKLAMQHSGTRLTHTFSDSQIFSRIKMLTKPKTNPMQKIRFFSVVPMLVLIITLVAFIDSCKPDSDKGSDLSGLSASSPSGAKTIAVISWEGNEKYSDDELTGFLGLKPGDIYDSVFTQKRLYDGKGVVSRYMDDGHLFFRAEPVITENGGQVDVKMKIYEGEKAKFGKVIIKGLKKTDRKKVLDLISVKEGSGFNRSALILSQSQLSKSGLFKSDAIAINPLIREKVKGDEFTTVDMEFEVTEL